MKTRRRWRLPLTLAALAASSVLSVSVGRGSSTSGLRDSLIGTWMLGGGSKFTVTCGDKNLPLPAFTFSSLLDGTSIALRARGEPATLQLELGCYCSLLLDGSDQGPFLLRTPTTCSFYYDGRVVEDAHVVAVELSSGSDDSFEMRLQADSASLSRLIEPDISCSSFSLVGTLRRTSEDAPNCGSEDTAVGVIAYGYGGMIPCPFGPGREGVDIYQQEGSRLACASASSFRGEGGWVLPQTRKSQDIDCHSTPPDTPPHVALHRFCRVDGQRFLPLALEAGGFEHAYALLKLGDRCPNGSFEMIETIDNGEQNNQSQIVGRSGANFVNNGPGISVSTLRFCYFPPAAPGSGGMREFPDLGFSYAVFHDFDGPQPPWVILKHWEHIQADPASSNSFSSASDVSLEMAVQFQKIIESPEDANFLEMARVR